MHDAFVWLVYLSHHFPLTAAPGGKKEATIYIFLALIITEQVRWKI